MSENLSDTQLKAVDYITKLEEDMDILLKGLRIWLDRPEDTQVILVNLSNINELNDALSQYGYYPYQIDFTEKLAEALSLLTQILPKVKQKSTIQEAIDLLKNILKEYPSYKEPEKYDGSKQSYYDNYGKQAQKVAQDLEAKVNPLPKDGLDVSADAILHAFRPYKEPIDQELIILEAGKMALEEIKKSRGELEALELELEKASDLEEEKERAENRLKDFRNRVLDSYFKQLAQEWK